MDYSPPGSSVHGISQIQDQSWSQEKRKCWRVSHGGFLCYIPVAANHHKYQTQIPHLGMLTFRFWRPILTINNSLLVPGFLASFVCFYLWWAVVWGLHVRTSIPLYWPADLALPVPMMQAVAQGPVICWQITQAPPFTCWLISLILPALRFSIALLCLPVKLSLSLYWTFRDN